MGGAQGGVVGAVGAFAFDVEQGGGALAGEGGGRRVQTAAVCVGVGTSAQEPGHQGEGTGGLGDDDAAAVLVVRTAQVADTVFEPCDGGFADTLSVGELAGGGRVGCDPGEQRGGERSARDQDELPASDAHGAPCEPGE
ncbi:hypothetical protein [Streptomyces sp. NPDC056672]|uniref:hypothetical protein n=1 Tax=Streptomyces sp. NPDC056672 TaxID=3345906 RepID=UPI0036BCE7D9